MLWMAVCLIVSFTGCTSEEMDYNNPDVALFVKQLKSGTYKMKNEKGVVEVPHFTEEDIPELLKYAEDLTIIGSACREFALCTFFAACQRTPHASNFCTSLRKRSILLDRFRL